MGPSLLGRLRKKVLVSLYYWTRCAVVSRTSTAMNESILVAGCWTGPLKTDRCGATQSSNVCENR